MALQILENNGIFYVNGKINASTTRSFMIHFDYVLDGKKKVIIDVNALKEIDVSGLEAFKTLYRIAIKNNKILSIIGCRSKDIYKYFQGN